VGGESLRRYAGEVVALTALETMPHARAGGTDQMEAALGAQ
jgi:hypothetical protein